MRSQNLVTRNELTTAVRLQMCLDIANGMIFVSELGTELIYV